MSYGHLCVRAVLLRYYIIALTCVCVETGAEASAAASSSSSSSSSSAAAKPFTWSDIPTHAKFTEEEPKRVQNHLEWTQFPRFSTTTATAEVTIVDDDEEEVKKSKKKKGNKSAAVSRVAQGPELICELISVSWCVLCTGGGR